MRVFISIEIPSDIRLEVENIQRKLPLFNGKLTEKQNLHLTLKFLGEVEDKKVAELKRKLKKLKFKKFESGLGNLGTFKPNFLKIIWIKLENCEEIQKEVDKILEGLFPVEKGFMSHLTLARVKDVENKDDFFSELKGTRFEKKKFIVDRIFLKKSTLTQEGPIYETLAEIELS
jgi:RNA 2',3'-cyclic 3'-phosphodiesterase